MEQFTGLSAPPITSGIQQTKLCMKKAIFVITLFFLLAGCAAAARILYPVNTDPLKLTPGAYALDPAHANIIFAVNHLGFSFHHGRFNKIGGSLVLDVNQPENSQLFIKIDTASIDTNNTELDSRLRAKPMFNSEVFPSAIFEGSQVEITGPKTANVTGTLTIKENRVPITIQAEFIGSGTNPANGKHTVGFRGKATFNRSEFGLNEWLSLVGDEVSLILEAEFVR